jgi:hypothetical protein
MILGGENRCHGEVHCPSGKTDGSLCGQRLSGPNGPSSGPKGQPFLQPGLQALVASSSGLALARALRISPGVVS